MTNQIERTKSAYSAFIAEGHPIAMACEPMRNRAMDYAQSRLEKRIAERYAELLANYSVAKGYPKSFNMCRADYKQAMSAYRFDSAICNEVKSPSNHNRMYEPRLLTPDTEGAARLIAEARAMAALSYDAFIVKLIGKAGNPDTATIDSGNVWDHSNLTCTKDGVVTKWRTQCIVNCSVHGLLFNQWPTRIVK